MVFPYQQKNIQQHHFQHNFVTFLYCRITKWTQTPTLFLCDLLRLTVEIKLNLNSAVYMYKSCECRTNDAETSTGWLVKDFIKLAKAFYDENNIIVFLLNCAKLSLRIHIYYGGPKNMCCACSQLK